MLTIINENEIISTISNIKSAIRSFMLLGSFNRIKFGKSVKLSGQISFSKNINIGDYTIINGESIRIENNVYIHENVLTRSLENITTGEGTTINKNCCILHKLKIGKLCSIAPGVIIFSCNHIPPPKKKTIKEQGVIITEIVIEDDVWIGANATILNGVTIAMESIIAAGAVVNKDVEPFSIVGGVPANLIKARE